MTRILSKDFVVVVVITLLLLSGIIVHLPKVNNSGKSNKTSIHSNTLSNLKTDAVQGRTELYITNNITVQSGTTLLIKNEDVIFQSLSAKSLSITSSGNLQIINSTLELSNASYSTVSEFQMYLLNGSSLILLNSSIDAVGSLNFSGSSVTIDNSHIASPNSGSRNLFNHSLTLQIWNSTLDFVNSSLSGLYEQNSSIEYSDGPAYLSQIGFSQTSTVPMKYGNALNKKSYINGASGNITYYGNSNETIDSLQVYYNNSLLDTISLPYNTENASQTKQFSVNFTGELHNLTWVENTSNFKFLINMTYSTGIALTNLTVNLMSNDTVHLYGRQFYDYILHNTTFISFNSTINVNENSIASSSGEPNFRKLSILAYDSTIILGDTAVNETVNYVSPFFQLNQSTLYLFREIAVNASFQGITYSGLKFTISPSNSSSSIVSNNSVQSFHNTLALAGLTWIYGDAVSPVLYETVNNGTVWNYTNSFEVNAIPGSTPFSVNPFPSLTKSIDIVNYTLPVPYATFLSPGNVINFNGSISIQYTGNLTGLSALNVSWTVYNKNLTIDTGASQLALASKNQAVNLPLKSIAQLPSGNYSILLSIGTSGVHAFKDTVLSANFTIARTSSQKALNYTFKELGLPKNTVWGLEINNTRYYGSSTDITVLNIGNQNVTVIAPNGYRVNSGKILTVNGTYSYLVSFSRIYYNLTFIAGTSLEGQEWSVTVNGQVYYTNSSAIIVSLDPGKYNYEIQGPNGYALSNSTGIVNLTNPFTVHFYAGKKEGFITQFSDFIQSPLNFSVIVVAASIGLVALSRSSYHSWYVCERCGSTRKRKRDMCVNCEFQKTKAKAESVSAKKE